MLGVAGLILQRGYTGDLPLHTIFVFRIANRGIDPGLLYFHVFSCFLAELTFQSVIATCPGH